MNKNNCSLLLIVILLIYFLISNYFTTSEHFGPKKSASFHQEEIDDLQTSDPYLQTMDHDLQTSDPYLQTMDHDLQTSDPYLQTSDPYLQLGTSNPLDSSGEIMLTTKQKLYDKKEQSVKSYNDLITSYKVTRLPNLKKKTNLDHWRSEMAEKGVNVSTDDPIRKQVTATHKSQSSGLPQTAHDLYVSTDDSIQKQITSTPKPSDIELDIFDPIQEQLTTTYRPELSDVPLQMDYNTSNVPSSSITIPPKYKQYSTQQATYYTEEPTYKDYLSKMPTMSKYNIQIFPKTTGDPLLIDEYSNDMTLSENPLTVSDKDFHPKYISDTKPGEYSIPPKYISDTKPGEYSIPPRYISDTKQNDEFIYYENGGKNIIVDPKSGKKFIETSRDPRQLIQSLDDDNIVKKSYDSSGNEVNEIFDKDGNKIAMYSPDTGRVYKAATSVPPEKLSREVKINNPLPYQEDYPQVTIKPDRTYDKMKNDYGQMKDDYSKLKEELNQYKIKDSEETPFPKERIQWSDKYKQHGSALDEVGKPVIDPLQTNNCVNNVTLNILSDSKRIRRLRQYKKYKNNNKRDKDFTAKINKNVLKREIENDIENEINKNGSNKINGKRRSRKKNRWNRHLDTNQALLSNYYGMKQKKC